jgi:hypothetical protein
MMMPPMCARAGPTTVNLVLTSGPSEGLGEGRPLTNMWALVVGFASAYLFGRFTGTVGVHICCFLP